MKIFRIIASLAVLVLVVAFMTAPAEAQSLVDYPFLNQLGIVSSGSTMLGTCVSLAGIKGMCGANPGGTTELYIISKYDLDTLPEPLAGEVTIETAIIPKVDKGFSKWEFAIDTGDMNFAMSGDPGSQAFEHTIGVYIPRFTAEILKEFNKLPNGEFIAIKVDSLGQQWVFGDLKRPLTPKLDYKSGKKFNEKNGTEFGLTVGNGHVPYLYTGEIPVVAVVPAA